MLKYQLTVQIIMFFSMITNGQNKATKPIFELIEKYSLARENRDTTLLKQILNDDIDQLVSNGVWRTGLPSAISGMIQSSATRPGTRRITIEKVKFLYKNVAIADARYEIVNDDDSITKMWSTFIAKKERKYWKITAIRNMLPSKP